MVQHLAKIVILDNKYVLLFNNVLLQCFDFLMLLHLLTSFVFVLVVEFQFVLQGADLCMMKQTRILISKYLRNLKLKIVKIRARTFGGSIIVTMNRESWAVPR